MNSITVMGGRRVMPHIRVQGGSTRVVCGWKAHEVRPKCTGTWGGREGMRRTGREREREKRSQGSTCCRVSASPCDLCAVTAPPTCIYAWKLLLHRPNISLLMFHRDTLFGGRGGHLDLPKHFKSYRSSYRS